MRSPELQVLRNVMRILHRINIHPGYFIAPVLLTIGAAAFEGMSLSLLVPLLNGFLTKDFSFAADIPFLGSFLHWLSDGTALRDRTIFLIIIAIFSVSILLKNILKFSSSVTMMYLATRSTHHLRKVLFGQYLSFGKMYFDRSTLGHHMTVLTNFAQYALMPVLMIDRFFQAGISLVVYFVILLSISWKLTLAAIPLFVVLNFSVRFLITGIQRLSKEIAVQTRDLGKKSAEILSSIPLVKVSNREGAEQERFTEVSDMTARLDFKKNALQRLIPPLQEIVTLVAVLFLFVGMLYLLIGDETTIDAPVFLVYFYIILNAATKFSVVTGFRGDVVSVSGQVNGVLEVLDEPESHAVPDGKDVFTGITSGIELRNLSFSYGTGSPQLSGVSFSVRKGSMVAIVGPTGAGKTTLVNLLLRFYDCPPGTILLDGKDIRSFTTTSLRNRMAIVSQETLLLHDTFRANITYGMDAVSDAELTEVITRARLDEVVARLPAGLETPIGDRGVKLSGGEKQRVSIARAMLRKADILILDEATSALDSVTEKSVHEAIEAAIAGQTALVIAHRLATIKHADRIVVLDDGRSVEQGTLQELLDQKGLFFRLWEEQKFS